MKDTAERIVDGEITLIPYYRNDEVSLPWYQNRDLVKMVDNHDTPYDIPLLHRMYDYLSENATCADGPLSHLKRTNI